MKQVIYQIIRRFVLLTFLVVIVSCKHIQLITKAQESFSLAAALENELTFKENDDIGDISKFSNTTINYNMAYSLSSKALKKHKNKLEKDGLLGTAYSIKALSAWKLGKFDEAEALSKEAIPELKDQPRDEALMIGITGLIKAEQAFIKLGNSSSISTADYQDIKKLICDENTGALADITKATQGLEKGHSLFRYFQLVRVSITLTLDRAELRSPQDDDDFVDDIVKTELKALRDLIGCDSSIFQRFFDDLGKPNDICP